MSFPSYMPPPRLCHLKKWHTYAGYGFNLHAEKGKAGQYIGKVDPDSPAELGGLKSKDYLIEVNGTNVEDFTHQKVVERVKDMPDMVKMLVLDMDTYKFCKENGIVISSDMPEVVAYYTPDTQPTSKDGNSHQEIHNEVAQHQQLEPQQMHQEEPIASHSAIEEVEEEEVIDSGSEHSEQSPPQPPPQPQLQSPPQPQPPVSSSGSSNGSDSAVKDPVANISLEEMRSRIGGNRRNQVKMNPSSFSEKYSMFQAL